MEGHLRHPGALRTDGSREPSPPRLSVGQFLSLKNAAGPAPLCPVVTEGIVSSWAGGYPESVMSIAEVKQLPLAEKLQIMEAIWEELRARADQVPVPQWHKELLDARRKAVEEGHEEVLDWDSIKHSLPSRRKS